MRESKANTILNQYLREKRMYCYYELKVVKGNTFNFSKMEINQDEGLPALAKEGLVWKLSDEDSRRKPCDGFCAPPLPAYLVLKLKDSFYFLDYTLIRQFKHQKKESLSAVEIAKWAVKVIHT